MFLEETEWMISHQGTSAKNVSTTCLYNLLIIYPERNVLYLKNKKNTVIETAWSLAIQSPISQVRDIILKGGFQQTVWKNFNFNISFRLSARKSLITVVLPPEVIFQASKIVKIYSNIVTDLEDYAFVGEAECLMTYISFCIKKKKPKCTNWKTISNGQNVDFSDTTEKPALP